MGSARAPGTVSFTVTVPTDVSNLAPMVELLGANGSTILASAGPSATDFSASITATLPAAGSYRLVVASSGGYGNVGHYAVNGTIVPLSSAGTGTGTGTVIPPVFPPVTPPVTPPAPVPPTAVTNLSVKAQSSNRVVLTWQPASSNTQGYMILRSTNGKKWVTVGAVARERRASRIHRSGEQLYYYSVRAYDTWGVSPSSRAVHVRTPKVVVIRKVARKSKLPASPQKAAPRHLRPKRPWARSHRLHTTMVDTVLMGWEHPLLKRSIVG